MTNLRVHLLGALFLVSCTTDFVAINCLESPEHEVCRRACERTPEQEYCSECVSDPNAAGCSEQDGGSPPEDAAPADATVPDAAPPDASVPDAATPDATSADAGLCGECPPSEPLCDPETGVCVQCLSDAHCPELVCHLGFHRCAECFEDDDCPESHVCFESEGICVECLNAEHCPERAPFCERDGYQCVECLDNEDCGPERPFCQPELGRFACHECNGVLGCTLDAPACDHGTCEGCDSDRDCGAAALLGRGLCDFDSGACVGCRDDIDCNEHPDGRLCRDGVCTP